MNFYRLKALTNSMFRKLSYAYIIIFTFSSLYSSAQNLKRFRSIDTKKGLSHTDATCFVQDENGFVWIGTYKGLNRYDGYNVKQFNYQSAKNANVNDNRISSLKKQGKYLWVGSENGIHYFDTEFLKYRNIKVACNEAPALKKEVKTIYVNSTSVWYVSGNTLYKGEFDSLTNTLNVIALEDFVENYPPEIKTARILHIIGNSTNKIWLATSKGVFEINHTSDKYRFTHAPYGNIIDYISHIDYSDKLLFAINNNLVYIFMLNANQSIQSLVKTLDISKLSEKHGIIFKKNINVVNIKVDANMNIWCATSKGLLLISNPLAENVGMKLMNHSHYDSHTISADHTSSLFIDKSNCLWIGTWGRGVNVLDLEQKKFNVLNYDPERLKYNISRNFVKCIAEDDANNNIWIGFKEGGLNIFNPETGIAKPFKPKQTNGSYNLLDNVKCMAIGRRFIAIGCMKGLVLVEKDTWKLHEYINSENDPNSIPKGEVYAIKIDSKDNVWAGFWKSGLSKIAVGPDYQIKSTVFNPQTTPSLTSNKIVFLNFSSNEKELFASSPAGLNRILIDENRNVEQIVHYRAGKGANSLKSEYIWPTIVENDTTLWLGMFGGGIYKITIPKTVTKENKGKYTAKFHTSNGSINDDIEVMLKDKIGNIWYGGGRGLSCLNIKDGTIWNFDEDDGLHGNSFKIGASYMGKDGTFYLGGVDGLTYFQPDEIIKNTTPAKVKLVSFSIKKEKIAVGDTIDERVIIEKDLPFLKKIRLNADENDFSIHFSSMHFSNPIKCKYKYRLIPYQKKWIEETGVKPSASYSNMNFGKYKFQVKATNNDGVWNEKYTEIEIIITPPWYLSTIAIITYFLVSVLIMFSIYKYAKRLFLMKQNIRLMETEELKREELHQHKLQFFTNITHEFKTPLTLIQTPLEKLFLDEKPNDERKKLYNLVFNNTKRLQRLINELMDFRKVELGKNKLKTQLLDLNSLVNDVFNQFVSLAQNKKVELSFEQGELPKIWIDEEKIKKVTNNLFSNALKFTKENGSIQVKTSLGQINNIKLSYSSSHSEYSDFQAAEYAILEIKDTGLGISEKSIKYIFDRFYHEDHSSDQHLGSGIGLALVKSFIMLHKGCVIVNSERNKGTHFIIAFPIGDRHLGNDEKILAENNGEIEFEPDLQTISSASNATDTYQERLKPFLLIVEDNDELRNMLLEHFRVKFQVTGATNGAEGLKLAQEIIPDIVISDVMMPVMDGIDMCKKIRDDISTCHIPILLLTAKSSVDTQIIGAEIGADDFVAKPFNLHLLEVKIARIIEHQNVLKERYSQDVFSSTREIARNQKDKEFFDKLISFIEENIENSEFSVDDLAPELGVGRTKLYQKIKGITGKSPLEFIRGQRLKEAAKILLSEDVSVSEVVFRVGLQSKSYFSKAFKAEFKMTPTEFIKKYQDGKTEDLEEL